MLVMDMGGLPAIDTGLCAAAGDWGIGDTTEVMDMTLPPGVPLAAICICSGRPAAGDGATGLMASCGLVATEVLDVDEVEVAVLGLGESCDDMGEAGDIGVLLWLL